MNMKKGLILMLTPAIVCMLLFVSYGWVDHTANEQKRDSTDISEPLTLLEELITIDNFSEQKQRRFFRPLHRLLLEPSETYPHNLSFQYWRFRCASEINETLSQEVIVTEKQLILGTITDLPSLEYCVLICDRIHHTKGNASHDGKPCRAVLWQQRHQPTICRLLGHRSLNGQSHAQLPVYLSSLTAQSSLSHLFFLPHCSEDSRSATFVFRSSTPLSARSKLFHFRRHFLPAVDISYGTNPDDHFYQPESALESFVWMPSSMYKGNWRTRTYRIGGGLASPGHCAGLCQLLNQTCDYFTFFTKKLKSSTSFQAATMRAHICEFWQGEIPMLAGTPDTRELEGVYIHRQILDGRVLPNSISVERNMSLVPQILFAILTSESTITTRFESILKSWGRDEFLVPVLEDNLIAHANWMQLNATGRAALELPPHSPLHPTKIPSPSGSCFHRHLFGHGYVCPVFLPEPFKEIIDGGQGRSVHKVHNRGGAWKNLPLLHHLLNFVADKEMKPAWFVIADDDSFFIPYNLRFMLSTLKATFHPRRSSRQKVDLDHEAIYFGSVFRSSSDVHGSFQFIQGGAGIILNRVALELLDAGATPLVATTLPVCMRRCQHHWAGDIRLGCCAAAVGISPFYPTMQSTTLWSRSVVDAVLSDSRHKVAAMPVSFHNMRNRRLVNETWKIVEKYTSTHRKIQAVMPWRPLKESISQAWWKWSDKEELQQISWLSF